MPSTFLGMRRRYDHSVLIPFLRACPAAKNCSRPARLSLRSIEKNRSTMAVPKKATFLSYLRSSPPPSPRVNPAPPRWLPPPRREHGTCNKHRCTCHTNAYDDDGQLQPHPGMLYCIPIGQEGAHLGRYAYVDTKGKWHYTEFPLTRSQIRRRNASANQPHRSHFASARVVTVDTPPHLLPRSPSVNRRRLPSLPKYPQHPRPPTIHNVGDDPRASRVMNKMHDALYRSRCEEHRRRLITYQQELAQYHRDRSEQAAATSFQAAWRGWRVSSRLRRLRWTRHHVRFQGFMSKHRRNKSALEIQRIYRGRRARKSVVRRCHNRILCIFTNARVAVRHMDAVTIQSSVRRWLVQRHWKASYAQRLATKKLCRATTEHTRMIRGCCYDISPILEMSQPWPSIQPQVMPQHYYTPPSSRTTEGERGGSHRANNSSSHSELTILSTSPISLYQSSFGMSNSTSEEQIAIRRSNKITNELSHLRSQKIITNDLRSCIRLPYGEITPEQVYSIADPNYHKDYSRYDGIYYHKPSI